MVWGIEPKDLTHGPYNIKVVLDVTHPTFTTEEVRTFLNDVLEAAGRANILAKLRSDFNQPWIGTAPMMSELGPGFWQLYPKAHVRGNLKNNRDERTVVAEMYADARSALIQVCEQAGFTVVAATDKMGRS